ncbi:MAG TPA: nitroreductase family protein [Blastocatellia bacterium]|nr:nitroreductase family protein [Blastocatellia bacterium]
MIAQRIGSSTHPSLIKVRWTAESFADRTVAGSRLLTLLEAARWTPSYGNEQPWSFVVASKEDPVAHQHLLSCLFESNVARARRAPVLILSVVKLNFEADGNRNPYAFRDAGRAIANLTQKAAKMGLLVHQMSGFDAARARELFDIPSGYAPVSVIAIGYPAVNTPSDNVAVSRVSQSRRPLQSLIFTERWGQPAQLLMATPADPCDEVRS